MAYMEKGTMTGMALQHMLESSFSEAEGARPLARGIPRIGLVFTDGRSQDDISEFAEKAKQDGRSGILPLCFPLGAVNSLLLSFSPASHFLSVRELTSSCLLPVHFLFPIHPFPVFSHLLLNFFTFAFHWLPASIRSCLISCRFPLVLRLLPFCSQFLLACVGLPPKLLSTFFPMHLIPFCFRSFSLPLASCLAPACFRFSFPPSFSSRLLAVSHLLGSHFCL